MKVALFILIFMAVVVLLDWLDKKLKPPKNTV